MTEDYEHFENSKKQGIRNQSSVSGWKGNITMGIVDKEFTDQTKISSYTWGELKHDIKMYSTKDFGLILTEKEKIRLKNLTFAQKAQGDMDDLKVRPLPLKCDHISEETVIHK